MQPAQHPSAHPSRRGALAALAGLTLAGAGALAGCQDKAGTTTQPASAAPVTSPAGQATSSPSPSPTATASQEPQTDQVADAPWHEGDSAVAQSSGDGGVETDLRTGQHDGYDRVVVETNGTGTLGYQVDVIAAEEAATQGRGDQVSVAGSHVIRVIGRGTHMPISDADVAADYAGPRRVSVDGQALREVVLDPTFEGQFQLFLGTESTTYRVLPLSNPTRLVIDVRH